MTENNTTPLLLHEIIIIRTFGGLMARYLKFTKSWRKQAEAMMQVVSPLMMQSHKELLKVKMLRERWSQSQKQTDILDRKKGGQTLR